jgi:hypothetical protein
MPLSGADSLRYFTSLAPGMLRVITSSAAADKSFFGVTRLGYALPGYSNFTPRRRARWRRMRYYHMQEADIAAASPAISMTRHHLNWPLPKHFDFSAYRFTAAH